MRLKLLALAAVIILTAVLPGCGKALSAMQDGYYSAEAVEFDKNNWKEFVTIYVSGGRIITVEYDALNPGGFVKSWDVNFMRKMKAEVGTYPSEYSRIYTVSLINWQNVENIESVAGAEESRENFKKLAEAAISKAIDGDKSVALVEL